MSSEVPLPKNFDAWFKWSRPDRINSIYLTKTPYILYSGINGLNPNISELVKKICLTKNLRPWESVDLFLFSHDLHVCLTSVTVRRN